MSQTVRAFVAVEINPVVRQAAVELIGRLRTASADVKWVAPENLHLTLKFLGDTALNETPRICNALERAVSKVEPFELALAGAGAFPTTSRPRTIWLGATGDDRPMRDLHKQVELRLQKLGFRLEGRRFQAHLTLGRLRRGGSDIKRLSELLEEFSEFEAGKTLIEEIVLFSSQLTPDGPIYQSIGRAKLGGG